MLQESYRLWMAGIDSLNLSGHDREASLAQSHHGQDGRTQPDDRAAEGEPRLLLRGVRRRTEPWPG